MDAIELKPTIAGYTTTDGRFKVTRSYRQARRGPADRVADGWSLADTYNGWSRPYDTLKDVKWNIRCVLAGEDLVSEWADMPPSIVVYWQSLSARFPTRSPGTEVWLHANTETIYGEGSNRRGMLGLFYADTGNELVERVNAALDRVGVSATRMPASY